MDALYALRREIDALDDRIIDLLAERFGVVRRVAAIKPAHGLPSVLPDRIEAVLARNAEHGFAKGLDPAFVRRLYDLIIAQACAEEDRLMGDTGTIPPAPPR